MPSAAESQQATTPASAVAFTDVTAEAGLGSFRHETGAFGEKWFPETFGAGGGFLDYDSDGWLDILLVGGSTWPERSDEAVSALRLYRNQGDGTFAEVTNEAGLGGLRAYGFGIATADYDNDGDEDVYFTTLGENKLFRNDPLSGKRAASGYFTDVSERAGVAGEPAWSSSALFFDADRDGYLDLYVGNYADWSPETNVPCMVEQRRSYCAPTLYDGVLSRFYYSNGEPGARQPLTFTDRTEEAGFSGAPGKTFGVAELDFNRDNWPDLVVANDLQRDLLYRNTSEAGRVQFAEEGIVSGIAFDENGIARGGMGIDVGVVDTTGEPTVFVGNFSNEMIGVYRQMRDGIFLDRAAISKIGRPSLMTLTFGLFLFDVDLDGDLDLFAANGHVFDHVDQTQEGVTYRQPAQLFEGLGDGTFRDVEAQTSGVLEQPMVARGAAYGDYDRDGDLDVLITENGGPAHLWRNDGTQGGFLRVTLEGSQSNRSALGSRIVVYAEGARQERRVRGGSSYLSQSEKAATFGLGEAPQVDSLTVYWPSGTVERFTNVAANQHIHIVEGRDVLNVVPMPESLASR